MKFIRKCKEEKISNKIMSHFLMWFPFSNFLIFSNLQYYCQILYSYVLSLLNIIISLACPQTVKRSQRIISDDCAISTVYSVIYLVIPLFTCLRLILESQQKGNLEINPIRSVFIFLKIYCWMILQSPIFGRSFKGHGLFRKSQ